MHKLLQSTNIIKSFPTDSNRHVLDGVSMELAVGEFVAVMGASGCGKSTLLYALSGMDTVDSGEILFDGDNIATLSDDALSDLRRKKMGVVFQQPTMLKNLNILDNIILPAMRNNKKDRKNLVIKAKKLMQQAGITELAARSITQVSGGQLQRAGICRAMMNSPKILFADEPTGALNAKSSDEMMALFEKMHQSGTAIFMVTHDAKVAAKAQRVLLMQDGKITKELCFNRKMNFDQKLDSVLQAMRNLSI